MDHQERIDRYREDASRSIRPVFDELVDELEIVDPVEQRKLQEAVITIYALGMKWGHDDMVAQLIDRCQELGIPDDVLSVRYLMPPPEVE